MPAYHDALFAAVKRIPKGRIASYGGVAALAGHPRTARFVGHALRLGRGLPWWRVVGADGTIRIQNPQIRREQVALLAAEGVRVDDQGRVVGWRELMWAGAARPGGAGRRRKSSRAS